jgi:hypothetical protein
MKRILPAALIGCILSVSQMRAEFLQMDLSIFGMD